MIYILSGNDIKKKNAYLKNLCKNDVLIVTPQSGVTKESIFEQAQSVSLFGESPVVILENLIKEGEVKLSSEDLLALNQTKTVFVFMEDKLLAPDLKKYKKYATVEDFNKEALKAIPKTNIFGIADAFSRRDKIGTWILYREAVLTSASPEEISGIIFWKIKTMLLSGTKFFSSDELKNRSSELVSIYHKAHRGECDFTISLEQFILSSLGR